jgi:hypothetical protein
MLFYLASIRNPQQHHTIFQLELNETNQLIMMLSHISKKSDIRALSLQGTAQWRSSTVQMGDGQFFSSVGSNTKCSLHRRHMPSCELFTARIFHGRCD